MDIHIPTNTEYYTLHLLENKNKKKNLLQECVILHNGKKGLLECNLSCLIACLNKVEVSGYQLWCEFLVIKMMYIDLCYSYKSVIANTL